MTTPRPFVQDPALTAMAVGYANPDSAMIADRVFPRVSVGGEMQVAILVFQRHAEVTRIHTRQLEAPPRRSAPRLKRSNFTLTHGRHGATGRNRASRSRKDPSDGGNSDHPENPREDSRPSSTTACVHRHGRVS